jgi:hypothetical protein
MYRSVRKVIQDQRIFRSPCGRLGGNFSCKLENPFEKLASGAVVIVSARTAGDSGSNSAWVYPNLKLKFLPYMHRLGM